MGCQAQYLLHIMRSGNDGWEGRRGRTMAARSDSLWFVESRVKLYSWTRARIDSSSERSKGSGEGIRGGGIDVSVIGGLSRLSATGGNVCSRTVACVGSGGRDWGVGEGDMLWIMSSRASEGASGCAMECMGCRAPGG